jgi:3-oxoacyl-[acyl-carrier-protein] synthase II
VTDVCVGVGICTWFLQNLEEGMDMNTVPNVMQEMEVTAALSNSFGFGGHNSCCVFAPYKA